MREGKYEMEVLYTVVSGLPTSNIPEENSDDIEMEHKYAVEQAGGYRRTVKTSIKSNAQVAKEDIELTINNKPCTDIEFIQGLTGDITKQLSFTCKMPANEIGKYDIKLKIPKLNINITKTNAVEYIQAMQNFTYSQCVTMTEHQERTLGDKRDGELYTMAKLKDGKCWMTQNLRYQLSTTKALTSQDSDVQQNWTPNRSTELTLSGRWDQDPEGYKTVRSYYNPRKPEYGVYYTHTAAAAGTTTNMSNDGDEATGSICPKGWRLPRTSMLKADHPINDFYMMAKHYVNDAEWQPNYNDGSWSGSNSLSLPPQNFTPSGYYDGSRAEMGYYDTHAIYWYSTLAYKNGYGENYVDRGYFMSISNYGVTPHAAYGKYFNGNSVRCIAREPQAYDGIKYMQDFTSDICAKMTQHQAVTLKDKRDNQNYIIAKLKDDKCWMTQNLRLKLDVSIALTSETSDVQASWTPTRSTYTSSCSDAADRWDQDPEGYKTVRSCYNEYQINSNGVYYTRTAATAGTAIDMNNNGDEATGSICPKGWRLPKTGTVGKSINNEFYSMARHYIINMPWVDIDANNGHWKNGAHDLSSYPQNFYDSGLKYDNYGTGYPNGNWWSSTIHSSDSTYAMTANSNFVTPINKTSGHGYSVRCIAR